MKKRSSSHGRGNDDYEVDEYGVRTDRPVYREEADAAVRAARKRTAGQTFGRILAAVLAVAVALAVLAGGYLWGMFGRVQYDTAGPVSLSTPADTYDPYLYRGERVADLPLMGDTADVTNILLMGIDSDSFEGRADTNILLSVNRRTKTVNMVSFMRDTWVTLPGVDEDGDGWDDDDRLNAAYSIGGIPLHLQMLEQNFRLHIDKYVAVNFEVFPQVVDAMGGVDVPCRGDEAERVPAAGSTVTYGGAGYVPMGNADGTYHMDGFQALQYARIRYLDADGDFSRTARQRKLISLMLEQAMDKGPLGWHTLLSEALPRVKTNIPRTEMMGLAVKAVGLKGYTINTSTRIPQDGMWRDANLYGMSVLQLTDPVGSVTELHRTLYAEKDEEI